MSSSDLFEFAKIPLHDFEQCLAFLEARPTLNLAAAAEKILWQAFKTFERLIKGDLDEQQQHLVQQFANQCVRSFAFLDYGRDCGHENLMRYLHNLVLTPERYRDDYLERMMRISPVERLEYIRRPVPGYLEKLKLFCILYDSLYEKIEKEARHRAEQTFLERVQTKLESTLNRTRTVSSHEIGRAI